jgi:hypothetical protein
VSDPFYYRPDPDELYCVQATGGKLVRRGPRAYFIVWTKADGEAAETPLAGPPKLKLS